MAEAEPASGVSTPTKKPHALAQSTQPSQDAQPPQDAPSVEEAPSTPEAPKPQRVASNRASAVSTVRPQLLASEEEPKPGPLSMFVRAAAGLSAQEEWMEVASPVNVRKGPSSEAGTDRVAPRGAKFRVLGREGNWVKVADPRTAQEGYIYNRFLKESSAP